MRFLALLIAAVSAVVACIPVEADRITAGDLAQVVPELSALPPSTVFGFAPLPGLTRNIQTGELRRFASEHKVSLSGDPSACVEYRVRTLTDTEVLEGVRSGLAEPNAEIELVEFSRAGVPKGKLIFDRRNLPASSSPAAGELLWYGYVQYGAQRRSVVWARLRVSVKSAEILANTAMEVGHVVTAEDIRVERRPHPWTAESKVVAPEMVVGRAAVRMIAAGTVLREIWFRTPPAVKIGDDVGVRVENGGATLQFSAKAVNTAQLGEPVTLLNPISGKRFKATVDGQKSAAVVIDRNNP